jgi:hypothetical protein
MPSKAEKIAAAKWAEQQARAALAAAQAEEVQDEQLPDTAPSAPVPGPRTYSEAITIANTAFVAALDAAKAAYDGTGRTWAAYDKAVKDAYAARNIANAEACKLPGVPASAPIYPGRN